MKRYVTLNEQAAESARYAGSASERDTPGGLAVKPLSPRVGTNLLLRVSLRLGSEMCAVKSDDALMEYKATLILVLIICS